MPSRGCPPLVGGCPLPAGGLPVPAGAARCPRRRCLVPTRGCPVPLGAARCPWGLPGAHEGLYQLLSVSLVAQCQGRCFRGTPQPSRDSCPCVHPHARGAGRQRAGEARGGEAELGSLVVAPAGFGTRMPLFVWPHSGFQGCQRRGGSGRVGAPEVWEPPRVPLSAPLSFSTSLAALAVPGREGCWMLLLAAAMTHQPRGAVAGNHRHPRRSPPDTAPAPRHCLWQPWGSSSRHCPTSCAVEPWEASQSPGKRVGAVGSVSEPWQRAGSVAGVAGASHGTRVPFQEVFPTRQLLSPRLGPPAPPAPYLRSTDGTLPLPWG